MKNPPILVSVIGFFAALAGLAWIFLGLRVIGFDWFGVLGDVQAFEMASIWGWLAVGGGILWLAGALGLWAMQPWAWLLTIVVAGITLFEAFLWMIEFPGTGIGLGMSIMPLLIILYMNSASVKAAFGLTDPPPTM
ncbi:MAG: hypothetical protein OEV61_01360 [Chloroflexota bacterium]|jgi:hypothetical protein|nr:hypothetical protein [Chloroflexota bacterium]MDH5244216.1 hypothetical protein [Chloroflexota bacterium]